MKQSIFIKMYIIPSIIISPMITISCNSWISIWMMMEFNMMSFIPMIIYYNNYYKELSMKYFLVQSISSSLMILMANFIQINLYNLNYLLFQLILNLTLIMKIGTPPFHYWFINMMKNMNWINCLILSTWQKITPMILMIYSHQKLLMFIIIIYSCIIGAIMNLNHQSLRIIFTYSSINHTSWMMLNLMTSELMWMYYFFSYLIINSSIMLMLNLYKIFYMNQLFIMNNFKYNKMFLLLNLLSISGLPPMFGFNMKWMSIYFNSWNNMYMLIMLMIFMSIITFMFYIRISISFLILSKMENKLLLLNKFYPNSKFNFFIMNSMLNTWILSSWMF